MNENIEKLCKKLLHYDDMIFGWRETVERVAESIVWECISLSGGDNIEPAWMISKKIKEHFGIEP